MMDDATINPVGAPDPVAPLPEHGQRAQPERRRKPTRRPAEEAPAAPEGNVVPGIIDNTDTPGPRGRHVDERA